MITDYSEIMCHIQKDLVNLQALLDKKRMDEAGLLLETIQEDLRFLREWLKNYKV